MADQVTVGATHQILIDGLPSWVKAEVTMERRINETIEECWDTASLVLQTKILDEVEKQANLVVEANKNQRKG